ncbi:folate/biopterin family MFS transporter [Candidatus Peribacteria bacterium]|nr:folate/biopterin family MFS transporter [Candidatus Peribacteria bacterium]
MRRPDLTTLLIPFVYFIAGATSLAGVATTFFYKDDIGLTIAQVQILGSIAIIPWSIKPIYGMISDRVPIWKLRRKPYLFIAGLCGSAGYFLMATVVNGFTGAVTASLLSALGFALADVLVDGIVAEKSRTQKEAGKLQTICRASLMTGAIAVSYLSGVLVESIGARNVFFITGSLPIFTSIFALLMHETPDPAILKTSIRTFIKNIRGLCTPALLWSILFLFLWRSTPTSGGAFSYFLIDELKFTPEFFGTLSLVSNLTAILGIVIFRKFLLSLPLRTLFLWIVILSIVLSLPTLGLVYGWYKIIGISPQFFAIADTAIGGALQEIGFLPLLVLAARLCPKGMEATMFALLASIMNIGLGVSDLGGAWLTTIFHVHGATQAMQSDYANLDIVMWIAILSSALPLPFLRFLPETRDASEVTNDYSPSALTGGINATDPLKSDIV